MPDLQSQLQEFKNSLEDADDKSKKLQEVKEKFQEVQQELVQAERELVESLIRTNSLLNQIAKEQIVHLEKQIEEAKKTQEQEQT